MNASTTAGSNCVPEHARSSAIASDEETAGAVGAVGSHRVVGVADEDDA